MKVKDVIENINEIERLIDLLEKSDLDYANEVVCKLAGYENLLKNMSLKEVSENDE